MKLLLDQGLPRFAAELLRQEGLDAVHTGECGLSVASDGEILAAGRTQGRLVITLDSDFHTILAFEGASGPSVIRVRWEGLRGPDMAKLIGQVLELCSDELESGAAVSVRPDGIRIRRLPMISENIDNSAEPS